MSVPTPTPIYRLLHVDNLRVCLERGALYAPRHAPADGLPYRTIHREDIQRKRSAQSIPCGSGSVIHDYVPFYFGPRSPMLYQLHTGWVQGYTEGQMPLIYLVSTAQAIQVSGTDFVFSDGHGIAPFTRWYNNLDHLDKVDWVAVHARMWRDTVNDPDRQRRKQAEFLVYRQCDWAVIRGIGVIDDGMRSRVQGILAEFPKSLHRPARVCPDWYY